MTPEKIIRMAREAGFDPNSSYTVLPMKNYASNGVSYELERFAALVAAHEREACAKVCEELETCSDAEFYGHEFANAIRARSNV